jgi:hypothetical protein
MNERIKQLAEQAGILKEQTVKAKIVKNEDGTWTSILEYPDLEKFAVLIVRECARIAIEKQTKNDILNIVSENPAKDFAYALVEHFGVEE